MPIPTFTPGYPPDGSTLGQTKSTVRNNLDGTFQTLAIDHIDNNGNPGAKPAGYHKVIHSVPQGSNPAPIAGYGQLYCKTINSFTNDQALFWETGAGLIQQLTVNLTPSAVANGYTFLPGGIIIQWGSIANPVNGSTVTFPVAFPTAGAPFSITLGPSRTTTGTETLSINSSNVTQANFKLITGSGSYTRCYWMAIGN